MQIFILNFFIIVNSLFLSFFNWKSWKIISATFRFFFESIFLNCQQSIWILIENHFKFIRRTIFFNRYIWLFMHNFFEFIIDIVFICLLTFVFEFVIIIVNLFFQRSTNNKKIICVENIWNLLFSFLFFNCRCEFWKTLSLNWFDVSLNSSRTKNRK